MRKSDNDVSSPDPLTEDNLLETQADATLLDLMLMHQRQAWRRGERFWWRPTSRNSLSSGPTLRQSST